MTTHTNQAEVVNAVVDDPDRFFDTVLVGYNFKSPPELKQAIARAAKVRDRDRGHENPGRRIQNRCPGGDQPHQAALKWALQDTNVTTAIPGMKDMAQLKEDIAVMGRP